MRRLGRSCTATARLVGAAVLAVVTIPDWFDTPLRKRGKPREHAPTKCLTISSACPTPRRDREGAWDVGEAGALLVVEPPSNGWPASCGGGFAIHPVEPRLCEKWNAVTVDNRVPHA